MWLSAVPLLTMVLILLKVFILGHYGTPSTGRIQKLAYNTNYKLGATKLLKLLNKYLVMVTFENGKNCSIRFEIFNNVTIFDSIHFETKKHSSHITSKCAFCVYFLAQHSTVVCSITSCKYSVNFMSF